MSTLLVNVSKNGFTVNSAMPTARDETSARKAAGAPAAFDTAITLDVHGRAVTPKRARAKSARKRRGTALPVDMRRMEDITIGERVFSWAIAWQYVPAAWKKDDTGEETVQVGAILFSRSATLDCRASMWQALKSMKRMLARATSEKKLAVKLVHDDGSDEFCRASRNMVERVSPSDPTSLERHGARKAYARKSPSKPRASSFKLAITDLHIADLLPGNASDAHILRALATGFSRADLAEQFACSVDTIDRRVKALAERYQLSAWRNHIPHTIGRVYRSSPRTASTVPAKWNGETGGTGGEGCDNRSLSICTLQPEHVPCFHVEDITLSAQARYARHFRDGTETVPPAPEVYATPESKSPLTYAILAALSEV